MLLADGDQCPLFLVMQAAKNQEEVDKLMKALDFNGDNEVDFNEFVVLVGFITCACYDRCSKK